MSKVHKYIPPVAADYSGACSVLFEMNTLCILYTPSGCIHPIVEIDEIRDFNNSFLFSTKLTDIEVIMGTEDKFLKNAEILVSNHPEIDFVSIIGTPVTSITGIDIISLGKKLEALTNKQVLVFETTGFENYAVGIDMTLKKLANQMIEPKTIGHEHKKQYIINIMGYNPLSLGHKSHLDECCKILENCGLEVHYFPSSENGLKSKDILSRTAVNIVVSAEGVGVAKDISDVYGIPFIVNIPVGIFGINKLLFDLKKHLTCPVDGNNQFFDASVVTKKNIDKRVLIIGGPLLSIAISQCFQHDFGMKNIKMISIMNMIDKICLMCSDDLFSQIEFIGDEKVIIKHIRKSHIIIADPIFESLMENQDSIFIPIPFPGLSGREFSNDEYEYIGKKGFSYFNQFLNTVL
jgi:nitrogenase molybdenum-iron protein alpha/beta subunit